MSLTLGLGLPSEKAIEYLRTAGRKAALDREDESTLREFVEYVHRIPAALISVVHYLTQEKRMRLVELMNPENKHLLAGFHEYDLQKGLRSLIAEQFKRQSPEERLMASVLSVFREPVPLAALQSALPSQDWYEWRLRLEHNTLFDIDRDAGLYDLTRGVREYVYEQIPGSTASHQADGDVATDLFTRNALHEKAADYYAQIRLPKEEWKTIEDFAPQFEEMYHSRQAGLYDRAANVLYSEASAFLSRAGYSRRAVDERKELVGKPMGEQSKAYNSGCLANAYSDLGEQRTAIKYFNEALEAFRRLKHRRNEGVVLGNIGNAYSVLGERRKAIEEYYTPALEIHREVGNRVNEGVVLSNIGNAYSDLGEQQTAIEYYKQALQIHREVGNRAGIGVVLGDIGLAYAYLDEWQKALKYYELALQIHREVGNRVSEGYVLGNEGIAKFALDEKEKGIQLVEQALEIARQVKAKMAEDYWLNTLEAMKGRGDDAP